MPVNVRIEGERELMRKLGELPGRVAKRSLGRALKAAAQIAQRTAKATAPVDTGALKRSLIVKRTKRRKPGVLGYVVTAAPKKLNIKSQGKRGNGGRTGYYPAYLEYGTPRMARRPFLAPAFNSQIPRMTQVIRETLRQEIEAAAAAK